ncbi:MAG: twin transmembrane helix small protein [Xanthomonadales bacterium]|nr:twin transmembrane helix small protein [Xanthomonadales bacterium]
MLVKAVIILFLVVILYSLGSAFVFMVMDKGDGERTLHRLMWRIGLSLFLLILLFFMFQMGWIEPSGGPIRYGAGG